MGGGGWCDLDLAHNACPPSLAPWHARLHECCPPPGLSCTSWRSSRGTDRDRKCGGGGFSLPPCSPSLSEPSRQKWGWGGVRGVPPAARHGSLCQPWWSGGAGGTGQDLPGCSEAVATLLAPGCRWGGGEMAPQPCSGPIWFLVLSPRSEPGTCVVRKPLALELGC